MLHGSLTDEKKLVEEDYDALVAFVKLYKFSLPLFKKVILLPNLWICLLREKRLCDLTQKTGKVVDKFIWFNNRYLNTSKYFSTLQNISTYNKSIHLKSLFFLLSNNLKYIKNVKKSFEFKKLQTKNLDVRDCTFST